MNNDIRNCVLGMVAGMRGEKRASKGKAIGRTLRRGWELLSGSRADRLAGAKARLTKELRRLGYQMETLTKDLDRSSPDPRNWSLPQTGQLGMPPLFSKNQAKVLNSSKWPSAASQNKALDAEIAAIGRRSSARRDALQHVGRLLDREQRAVDAARITGVATGGAGLGAGYGLHSLLGGKGDGEKKAAEAYVAGFSKAAELLGVDPARLAKQAQQRPMSRHDQQTLARMKALSAQLRGSTSPTVTRSANGTVTSTWRGFIPPASGSSGQAPAPAPVQRPAAVPAQRPAPAAGNVAPPSRRIQGLRVITQPEHIPQ